MLVHIGASDIYIVFSTYKNQDKLGHSPLTVNSNHKDMEMDLQ